MTSIKTKASKTFSKHELLQLLAINKSITEAKTAVELLAAIRSKVMELIPFYDTGILIVEKDGLHHYDLAVNIEGWDNSATNLVLQQQKNLYKIPHKGSYVEFVIARLEEVKEPIIEDWELVIKQWNHPFFSFIVEVGYKEGLVALLKSAGKAYGGFWLNSLEKNQFKKEQFSLFQAIAEQVSIAISNMLANVEALEREREKAVLLSLSEAITTIRDKNELWKIMIEKVKPLIGFKASVSTIYSADFSQYCYFLFSSEVVSGYLLPQELEGIFHVYLPIKDTSDEWVYQQGDICTLTMEEKVPLAKANPQAIDILRAAGIDYNLYIKLKIGGKVIGVQHYHFEDRNSVTEKNISLVKSITDLIALAIANILANEEIQYKEKQKALEIRANNAVLSNEKFSDVIREITASIENTVGCDITYIRIFNDEIDLKSFHFFCEKNGEDYIVKPVDEKVQETGTTPNQGLKNASEFLFTIQKPIILSGAELISLVPKYKYLQVFTNKLSIQSFMFLPLHLKYNSTAYLIIASKKDNAYTAKDLELMEGIITQVSLTLDNRLAFHQINKLKERLETENQYLQQEVEQQYNFDEMIGQNEAFNEVCKNIGLVANTDSTVLILGETGTGKELVARAIHNNSPRKVKPLIKLNCAALPASLIESELFGHERGAFTGALERRIGKFELANGSTLFLDEIGEMPLELQAKLLRALQEKEIERLGSNKTIKIDVRIIAATNRELEKDVLTGKFRQDLYYRLHIFPITLPPLRERKEDIPLLAAHF